MDISIVIVGWNARRYLELCLQSLVDAPPCRTIEVFVVDNASTDGSTEMIEARFPHVKVIKSAENLGFSKGNNLAIRRCTGRYIALVNPDVIVLPGCLDALADFLDRHPDVGNVGPRILNPDGTLQSSCRRFPSLWNNFCSATGLSQLWKGSSFFAGEHMFFFAHDQTRPVDVLVGCFSMIRRETFEQVGLLDEKLFMYGDDVDWCRRCWRAGWKVIFHPVAQAIHDRGAITSGYPIRFAVAQQRSVLYYWAKHHGSLGLVGIRSLLFCQYVVRYALGVIRLRRSPGPNKAATRTQVIGACLKVVVKEKVAL